MATQKVVIDPFTRIEGHLRITCKVENGVVTDAWNSTTLFRGFEIFMKNRRPSDCWQYAMRICGVCPTPHGVNAATAAERAMGVEKVSDNARLIRNMLNASMIGYDHILHFYILQAFDYVNAASVLEAKTNVPQLQAVQAAIKNYLGTGEPGLFSNMFWDNPGYLTTPEQNLELTAHYLESIPAQYAANAAGAVLAGKFPHIVTLAPGGMTSVPTEEEIIYYKSQMQICKDFNDVVMWNDLLAVAQVYKAAAGFGAGCKNFLTWGVLDGPEQTLNDRVFPAGAIFDGSLTAKPIIPDPTKVAQFTKYSYFPDDLGAGKPPLQVGQEPQDFTELPPIDGPDFPNGKYDWTQAANYPNASGKPVPCEVGPLAEVLVAYLDGEPLTVKYVDEVLAAVGATGKPEVLLSTLGRVAARVIKARVNTDLCMQWADELLANYAKGDRVVYTEPPNFDGDGEGWGAMDAPRGALSHYCQMKGGMTEMWAAVPASNWNLSPRNDEGVRGPVEEALVGTPCADPTQPLDIMRTVHSFDP